MKLLVAIIVPGKFTIFQLNKTAGYYPAVKWETLYACFTSSIDRSGFLQPNNISHPDGGG